jgi:hypothetical protein
MPKRIVGTMFNRRMPKGLCAAVTHIGIAFRELRAGIRKPVFHGFTPFRDGHRAELASVGQAIAAETPLRVHYSINN